MQRNCGVLAILTSLLAVLLIACGKPKGPGGEIWKEEVRLMNGDLIIVDRRNGWGESGDLSQGHGPLTEAEIHFDYKGKHYDWSQHGLAPTALQEDLQGRMYVVSVLSYCWAWREWGRPKSYYVVHRFEGGKWKRVDIADINVETVFNLAGESSEPYSTKQRAYVSETATKYAKNWGAGEDTRKIVLSATSGCQ